MSSALETLLLGQIRSAGLPTPEREVSFHQTRAWRLDLAWPVAMLAVEIDGGTWARGRHIRPKGYEEDCRKLAEAALQGWTVLRVTGGMVRSGEAAGLLTRALERFGGYQEDSTEDAA